MYSRHTAATARKQQDKIRGPRGYSHGRGGGTILRGSVVGNSWWGGGGGSVGSVLLWGWGYSRKPSISRGDSFCRGDHL